MLFEVLKHIRNFFPAGERINGKFNIEDGTISLPLLNGQYFLIEGSVLNDGVYQYPATDLMDEEFEGSILPMAIPKAFLDLATEISDYQSKVTATPYQSESFGGYSYTIATNKNGNMASWADAFGTRLNAWRKI